MINLLASVGSFFTTLLYILVAFVLFMIMIMIHEFGHYTAGKLLKFKITEFSIGMGPKIFSRKKKNGEVFSLRALPLGGYCAFEGETDDRPNNPESFNSQKPWKRLIVLFAGAGFNFISAIIFAIISLSAFGDTVAVVGEVYNYAPTANQQLQSGDIFYEINGKKVYVAGDFSYYFKNIDGEFDVTVIRNGEKVTLKGLTFNEYIQSVVATANGQILIDGHTLTGGDTILTINGEDVIGDNKYKQILDTITTDTVTIAVQGNDGKTYEGEVLTNTLREKVTVNQSSYTGIGMSMGYSKYTYSFVEALARSVPYCFEVAWLVLRTIGGLITGAVGLEAVGGPITTIGLTSQVVSTGIGNIIAFMAMISVNLAVFNLLPVPALDGCQMIFVLIEWIAGKPINRNVQALINTIGFFLLIGFVIIIDLLKL